MLAKLEDCVQGLFVFEIGAICNLSSFAPLLWVAVCLKKRSMFILCIDTFCSFKMFVLTLTTASETLCFFIHKCDSNISILFSLAAVINVEVLYLESNTRKDKFCYRRFWCIKQINFRLKWSQTEEAVPTVVLKAIERLYKFSGCVGTYWLTYFWKCFLCYVWYV